MQSKNKNVSWVRFVAPAVLFLFTVTYLFARFRAGARFAAFFEDDYFYYLKVARNIAGGHGSTFDGIHLTNGYHPLWLLANVLLALCFHGRWFYYVLIGVMCLSAFLTYGLVARCFRVYMRDSYASFCALLITAQFLLIMSGGMEIVLTIPLVALLCDYRLNRFRWTVQGGLIYGVLASLVVLSRLDSVLFIVMLATLDLFVGTVLPWRARLKASAAFIAGLIPVLVYVVTNWLIFHIATPVSGAAKQLRLSHTPDLGATKIALLGGWLPVVALSRPVLFGVLLCGILMVFRGRGRLAPEHRPLVWALMLFPFVQLGVLSIVSDWPIWEWYLYSFVVAAIGVVLALSTRSEPWLVRVGGFAAPSAAGLAVLLLLRITMHNWNAATIPQHAMYDFYYAAENIAAFGQTHPGIYAMGDRAGLAGAELQRPMIQLEGLMMDSQFLQNIRKQRDLLDVLRDYHVRYYIASDIGQGLIDRDGCFDLREPIQARPTSPVMRARLCKAPVYQFQNNGIRTYVFDMQQD